MQRSQRHWEASGIFFCGPQRVWEEICGTLKNSRGSQRPGYLQILLGILPLQCKASPLENKPLLPASHLLSIGVPQSALISGRGWCAAGMHEISPTLLNCQTTEALYSCKHPADKNRENSKRSWNAFIARIVSTKNTLHSFTIVVGFFPQKHQQFLRRMIYKRLKSKLCIKKKKKKKGEMQLEGNNAFQK